MHALQVAILVMVLAYVVYVLQDTLSNWGQ